MQKTLNQRFVIGSSDFKVRGARRSPLGLDLQDPVCVCKFSKRISVCYNKSKLKARFIITITAGRGTTKNKSDLIETIEIV